MKTPKYKRRFVEDDTLAVMNFAGSYQGAIITNENLKKIKVDVEYDAEFKIFRINVKLKKK